MSIELKPLATAKIQLRPPIAIENGPYGSRQVFEVVSAEFTGRFSATLKGVACADWLLVPAEGWRPSTSGGRSRRPTARSST